MKNVSVALIGARMRTPPWHSFLCISSAILVITVVLIFSTGCVTSAPAGVSSPAAPTETISPPAAGDIHTIKHVIIIMQENRAFDEYFGTYPGADGIPVQNGEPSVCVPDPATRTCVKPYHDQNDRNLGGPHGAAAAKADIDGGKMDGFIRQEQAGQRVACTNSFNPDCSAGSGQPDVMGYHDSREIPNYWKYADEFVLQDRMFEPSASWSLPSHLFLISAWSAKCSSADPMSCVNELANPQSLGLGRRNPATEPQPDYAWTDITFLLHNHGVSWAYYLDEGTQPDCENDAMFCDPKPQNITTPQIWNPLPWFDTVRADKQLANIQPLLNYYAAAKAGTLPFCGMDRSERRAQRASPGAREHGAGVHDESC
jgi:phospholipase C